MRARRIYSDHQKQSDHANRFDELRKLVFRNGGRRRVLKMLEEHPGKRVADSILDIVAKMDILDDDFRDLRVAVEGFWSDAFGPSANHLSYCRLQREVWRSAFHVAASAQSVTKTVESTMRKFSRRLKAPGGKHYEYWASGFAKQWVALETSPIYNFNHALRGVLYHDRLSNADWVGYNDFVTGRKKERFFLRREMLLSLGDRNPKALQYIETHSITVRGLRRKKGDEVFGLDLVAHYQRYRALLRKLCKWSINQLKNPKFGKRVGMAPYALDEYLDLERASLGVSKKWKRCRHCGTWSGN